MHVTAKTRRIFSYSTVLHAVAFFCSLARGPENEDQVLLSYLPDNVGNSLNFLCQASGTRLSLRVGQIAETSACLSAAYIREAEWNSMISVREQGEPKLRAIEAHSVCHLRAPAVRDADRLLAEG